MLRFLALEFMGILRGRQGELKPGDAPPVNQRSTPRRLAAGSVEADAQQFTIAGPLRPEHCALLGRPQPPVEWQPGQGRARVVERRNHGTPGFEPLAGSVQQAG